MVGGYALRYALEHAAVGAVTADRAQEARHLAPKAERGFASRLRRLLRTRGAALGSGRSGLLPGRIYRRGDGRGTPQDHRGLYDRVRASSPPQQPRRGILILKRGGADPTGRSRIPYARYKGEAEKALIAAGFPAFTSSDRRTSTPWSHGRNRISATGLCARSTPCFGCCSRTR